MINIKVAELMGKYKLSRKALSELTGIRPNTVSDLWYGRSKRVDIEYLNKLCEVFDCQPGDIFEYIPDKK